LRRGSGPGGGKPALRGRGAKRNSNAPLTRRSGHRRRTSIGYRLRRYNPESREWSLKFASSGGGTLTTPVIGSFRNGRGALYSQETFKGRAILVRFVISEITLEIEQAFSGDGGKTWEVNWIAVDTRVNCPFDKVP
jgi:hypothetical protein